MFVIFPASGDRSTRATEVVTGGEDAMETGFALPEIDTTTPHPVRIPCVPRNSSLRLAWLRYKTNRP